MTNLSIKRLAGVMATAILVAGYPAFAMAFQSPLPNGAGADEILARLQTGFANAANAIIPAVLSALVGFFTRADRNLPLNALSNIKGQE